MPVPGRFGGEAGVGEAKQGAAVLGLQLDGDDGFGPFRAAGAGDPGEFHYARGFDPEEASVVGVALDGKVGPGFEDGLEKKGAFTSGRMSTEPGAANQRSKPWVQAANSRSGAAGKNRSTVSWKGRPVRSGRQMGSGLPDMGHLTWLIIWASGPWSAGEGAGRDC